MPALLVARGTAIAWRGGAAAAPPVIPPAVGVDLRRWRLVTRGRRGVAWQRTVVGAAGTSFSVSVPAVASTLVIGTPTFSLSDSSPPLTNDQMQAMYAWISDLARLHGLIVGQPLVVTPTSRSAGALIQTISTDGSTVTVARGP